MARPSLFEPEYVEQVEKLARLGATIEEIADFFEVSHQTIKNWSAKEPEFLAALKRGRAASDMEVSDSLYKRATHYEWVEQQAIKLKTVTYGDNGKRLKEEERVELVEVQKVAPPDVTAMIFWLKNRRRADWRDRQDVVVDSRHYVVTDVPEEADSEAWAEQYRPKSEKPQTTLQ